MFTCDADGCKYESRVHAHLKVHQKYKHQTNGPHTTTEADKRLKGKRIGKAIHINSLKDNSQGSSSSSINMSASLQPDKHRLESIALHSSSSNLCEDPPLSTPAQQPQEDFQKHLRPSSFAFRLVPCNWTPQTSRSPSPISTAGDIGDLQGDDSMLSSQEVLEVISRESTPAYVYEPHTTISPDTAPTLNDEECVLDFLYASVDAPSSSGRRI